MVISIAYQDISEADIFGQRYHSHNLEQRSGKEKMLNTSMKVDSQIAEKLFFSSKIFLFLQTNFSKP